MEDYLASRWGLCQSHRSCENHGRSRKTRHSRSGPLTSAITSQRAEPADERPQQDSRCVCHSRVQTFKTCFLLSKRPKPGLRLILQRPRWNRKELLNIAASIAPDCVHTLSQFLRYSCSMRRLLAQDFPQRLIGTDSCLGLQTASPCLSSDRLHWDLYVILFVACVSVPSEPPDRRCFEVRTNGAKQRIRERNFIKLPTH